MQGAIRGHPYRPCSVVRRVALHRRGPWHAHAVWSLQHARRPVSNSIDSSDRSHSAEKSWSGATFRNWRGGQSETYAHGGLLCEGDEGPQTSPNNLPCGPADSAPGGVVSSSVAQAATTTASMDKTRLPSRLSGHALIADAHDHAHLDLELAGIVHIQTGLHYAELLCGEPSQIVFDEDDDGGQFVAARTQGTSGLSRSGDGIDGVGRYSDAQCDTTYALQQHLESTTPTIPQAVMLSKASYLAEQDKLYLSPITHRDAKVPMSSVLAPSLEGPPSPHSHRPPCGQCVLVIFAANDLRVHDNYTLALASVRAHAAGGIPVVAVCVLDYRRFAQPSAVGGFFQQSPQRAQFLLDTVRALRSKLEEQLRVPLLIRCGRPEEHVPRLVVELGAVDVFLTTQCSPHEKAVHDSIMDRVRRGCWVSRVPWQETEGGNEGGEDDDLVVVQEHTTGHPYWGPSSVLTVEEVAVPHSVWQTTLVHLDDLPTPPVAMKEGERWYHDDVTIATIRPTKPYDWHIARLAELRSCPELLPSALERRGAEPAPLYRGRLPTLSELGYGRVDQTFSFEEVVATSSSHPTPGEDAAFERVLDWLDGGGMTSMLRYGRERRTNTKMYSSRFSRVSPYLATGSLSPRRFYEMLRGFTHNNLRDSFVQQQYREALLRLSRRDYWQWIGLRYGQRLFAEYGPHPEETDEVPDWRHDPKIIHKWCAGLTGIPFADAAMRELVGTGFVAQEGRKALVWLLTRGYGQDWRIAAEWLERCSLDFDPLVCYGNAAYISDLIHDDFGEPVRSIHYLAHHNDQSGIYVKKWLPQLSKVPIVYIHRPHVLTPRMQAMHGIQLGRNYSYPLKLWDGALQDLGGGQKLTTYYPHGIVTGPGYGEAARYGGAVMPPEEWNAAMSMAEVASRPWAREHLPASAFEGMEDDGGEDSSTPAYILTSGKQRREGQPLENSPRVHLV